MQRRSGSRSVPMSTELTNLLPTDRRRAFTRRYVLRLVVVALIMLTAITVIHGLLLLPTYLYSAERIEHMQAQLAAWDESVGSVEEVLVQKRSVALQQVVDRLSVLSGVPRASDALRAILAVPRPGIELTGFTYAPALSEDQATRMLVSGQADSRDVLRKYAGALGDLPFISSADLPISAYAKERDIPFTITLTGTFLP